MVDRNPGGVPLDQQGNTPDTTQDDEFGRETGVGGGGTPAMHGDAFDDLTTLQEMPEELRDIQADLRRQEAINDARQDEMGFDVHQAMEDQAAERAAERARIEQERIEQMEAAHSADPPQPYLWETITVDGEEIEVWILPDGSVAHYNPETDEVVAFQWPEGEGPVYEGDMIYNGEAYAVYELPDGQHVLVDEDGNAVANLDDIDPDTSWHPGFETEVYYVPAGPPSYDTHVYDAETDELLVKVNTGSETLGILEGYYGTDAAETFYAYQPPGADYYLVLDKDGMVVDQVDLPPQEVWSVLGIVTYYDDGGVVVDLGVAELEVDVIGSEGGISLTVGDMGDLFEEADWLGGIEAGLEYDEDGVAIYAEADTPVGDLGAGAELGKDGFMMWAEGDIDLSVDGMPMAMGFSGRMGVTEDGQVFMGGDVSMEFQIPGGPSVDLEVEGYAEVGPQGLELSGGWDGGLGWGPLSLTGGQEGSFVLNEDGMLLTYSEYRGIAVDGLGEVRMGYEAQLEHNEDGTTARAGVYGQALDDDGDVLGTEGHYFEADGDGISSEWRQERLDTGVTEETYDKDHDDVDDTSGMPAELDGGSLFERPDDAEAGPGRRDLDLLPDEGAIGPGRLKLRRDADEGGADARPAIELGDVPAGVRDLASHRRLPSEDVTTDDLPLPGYLGETEKNLGIEADLAPDLGIEREVLVDDIVHGRPAVDGATTTEATPDQAPGRIERPDQPDTTEATPDQAPGRIERPDGDAGGAEAAGSRPALADDIVAPVGRVAQVETAIPAAADPDTTEATPDHAPGRIERPDQPDTTEATPDQAPGRIERPDQPVGDNGQGPADQVLVDDIASPVGSVAEVATAIPEVATPTEPEPAVEPESPIEVAVEAPPIAVVDRPEPVADPIADAVAPVEAVQPVADLVGDDGPGLDLADDGADDTLG